MREVLFVLIVIAVIAALTAYRYRRQIGAFYSFWKLMREARTRAQSGPGQIRDESAAGPLVNCAKCGNWVPENRAIKLSPRTFFCSAQCVEKTALS